MEIRDFTIDDYDHAINLWQGTENIGLSSADSRVATARFLERNPGLSKVAWVGGKPVGTLLCGHDGRRGYLYHLCVDHAFRRQGAGRKLVDACLEGLRGEGIQKCHLFIFGKNELGRRFWNGTGWSRRIEIEVFSRDI